jgi:hypothetical protein
LKNEYIFIIISKIKRIKKKVIYIYTYIYKEEEKKERKKATNK